MNAFHLFLLFFYFIVFSTSKQLKQWSDDSIPPPTTPTNTPQWPSFKHPSQSWPTDAPAWPPTMSPYPTAIPHIATTGNSKKKKLSPLIIAAIAVGSAIFVGAIVFGIIMLIRRFKLIKESNYGSILVALSDTDLSKTE